MLRCIKALKEYKVPPQTYNVVKVEVVFTESLHDLEELLEKAFENFYGEGADGIINYRVIEDEEQRNKTLGDMLGDGWDWDVD